MSSSISGQCSSCGGFDHLRAECPRDRNQGSGASSASEAVQRQPATQTRASTNNEQIDQPPTPSDTNATDPPAFSRQQHHFMRDRRGQLWMSSSGLNTQADFREAREMYIQRTGIQDPHASFFDTPISRQPPQASASNNTSAHSSNTSQAPTQAGSSAPPQNPPGSETTEEDASQANEEPDISSESS